MRRSDYIQGRIQDSPQEVAPTFQEGAPTYDFAKLFQKKLHEIAKIFSRRGGAGSAPLDLPLI